MNNSSMKRLIEIATTVAEASEGVGGRSRKTFKLGCVLFDKRGRVVKAKTNSMKTHPKLAKLTDWPFLHAEQACILSQGVDNCEGLNLLVVRVRKDGSFGNAEPCAVCKKLIKLAGVNNVIWSRPEWVSIHSEKTLKTLRTQ